MLLAVLSAVCFHATAQITITAATFPAVGDTFHFAVDLAPVSNNDFITPPGGGQSWDFSDLKFDQTLETVYQAPTAGMHTTDFPGADLLVSGSTGESYYNLTNNKFELLGYAGGDPANFGVQVLAKFSPPIIQRRSPMNFFDINQQATDLTLPFSTKALPDSLVANIPGISSIDSIRVRIHYDDLDVVDGWGDLKIPNMAMPTQVLRIKQTEYTSTAMDVHVVQPFPLGWVDISTFLGGGGPFGNFLGTDTTVTFRFYSNLHKEELAVVTTSPDQSTVESVRFKNIDMLTPAPVLDAPGAASVQAFPNPAIQWVRFDCLNLPQDEYTLKIFNIVGKVVWKNTYQITGNRSIKIDLEDFKKGTYLYSLVNQAGTIIGTKRLVVVKP